MLRLWYIMWHHCPLHWRIVVWFLVAINNMNTSNSFFPIDYCLLFWLSSFSILTILKSFHICCSKWGWSLSVTPKIEMTLSQVSFSLISSSNSSLIYWFCIIIMQVIRQRRELLVFSYLYMRLLYLGAKFHIVWPMLFSVLIVLLLLLLIIPIISYNDETV